jgi:methionine sulfoxide reductase heme-binding subunit
MSAVAAVTSNPSAYWYLTRGTGTLALFLLTLSVALGVANAKRLRTDAVPRFVVDAVHRNASLLALVFLLVHIVTAMLDGYAPIRLVDVVVPFGAAYRPLWLGLGAVALDLMVAVALTSLLRRRLGYGAWRATHWAAYASWPVALLHGLGTGSDAKAHWMLAVTGLCVIIVIVAAVARAVAGWPDHLGARLTALAASALVPIGLLAWLPSGPLAAGWAARAGTPTSLLAHAQPTATHASTVAQATTAPPRTPASSTRFTADLSGTMRQRQTANGSTEVDLTLSAGAQRLSALDIRLIGQPLAGGGIQMQRSDVTLGTGADPTVYRGQVVALDGSNIAALVRDRRGRPLRLVARLALDPATGNASGTLSAGPVNGDE